MESPTFWDNQEKARQIIAQLKPLNGLLNPYDELHKNMGDLMALSELCDEEPSLEAEFDQEWRHLYGEKGAKIIRAAVDQNMADYRYMKKFALKT